MILLTSSRNGEIHYYYVCLSKRRGKADCDCKAVKKQELEDYVIDATVSMLQRNSIITKIAETIVKVHEKIMRDNIIFLSLHRHLRVL
ncbi:MAG: zinc ribbon domain-containing protein [Oscillospiraceae bacterium]